MGVLVLIAGLVWLAGPATAQAQETPPAQMTGLSYTLAGFIATYTWTHPGNNTNIDKYQYRYHNRPVQPWSWNWSAWYDITGSNKDTVQVSRQLNAGGSVVLYQFRGVNTDADPDLKGPAASIGATYRLTAPRDFHAAGNFNAPNWEAHLTWTTPSITIYQNRYQYRQSTDGGSTYGAWNNISNSTVSTVSATVGNLTAGTEYTFQLRGAGTQSSANWPVMGQTATSNPVIPDRPTVRIVASAAATGVPALANGATTTATTLYYTITFDEAVTGFTAGDIALSGTASGAALSSGSFAGSGPTYTFAVGVTGDGTVAVDIAQGAAMDVDSNGNTAATTHTVTVDATSPTVTNVTAYSSDGTYKVGDWILLLVTFDEAVTVTGTPQLTLETGTTDRVGDYSSLWGLDQRSLRLNYMIQAGDTSSDLDYTATTALALNGGTITDAVGNAAVLTLPSPGAANSLGANKDIVIDTTLPTVAAVTSSTADGTYKAGDTVSIQVTFDEAVTVTETPQLTLETGTTDRVVDYASGSGGMSLTFTYTVQAGDTSSDLDYTATTALALNGGTIRDAAGHAAVLTLSSPGAEYSLGANQDIVIDTTLPTVENVTASTADGTYRAGDTVSIQVRFDEAVLVTGTPQLTLETGTTDRVVDYASGSGGMSLTFTYTVQAGDTSSDLDYTATTALALNGGTITDAVGHAAVLTLSSPGAEYSLGANEDIVIDTTLPTVENVTSSTADGTYKAGDTVSIQVRFDEAVTVTGTPQLTLETGTTDRVVDYALGSGETSLTFTYTVQAGDTSSDLDYTATTALALNGGTITDAAGHAAVLTLSSPGAEYSLGANQDIVIDGIAPTVTIAASDAATGGTALPNGATTTATTLYYTVTFSEAVTGFEAGDIALSGTASGAALSAGSFAGSGDIYTFAVDVTGDGTVAVDIAQGAAQDQAGNGNTAAETHMVTVDTTAPTVENVTSSTLDGTYSTGATVSIQVRFDEAVLVTGTPQLTLETGTTDRVVDYASGSGERSLTFTYTVQAGDTSSDLDYTATTALAFNGGTLTDAAGNAAVLTLSSPGAPNSLGANQDIVIDTRLPTVAIAASDAAMDGMALANGATTTATTLYYTVTFSEAVTGFEAGDIALSGTASGAALSAGSFAGSGDTYTFAVDVTGDGTVAVDIAQGAATDQAGSGNTAAETHMVTVDTTAPTVENVTSSTLDGTYSTGATVSIRVRFDEAVLVTGTPQLTLETGTTDRVVDYASGSGETSLTFTYTVQAGDTSSDLDYTATTALALNGGTLTDTAGNAAVLTLFSPGAPNSLGANQDIVIDGIAPTVENVTASTADGTYRAGDTVSIQVRFDEAVLVTGTPQLTLETGTTDRVVDYASGSGETSLTFTYTVQAGDTSSDLDYTATTALALNGGTLTDTAGNAAVLTLFSPGAPNSLGANQDIVIDGIAPTVENVTASTADGTYRAGATVSIQVRFDEAVLVTGTPQLTLETGTTDRVVDYASGSGETSLTFTYTVQAGDTSSDLDYTATTALALNGGTITDAVGHAAVLTLSSPGAEYSLGANEDIVIDTTLPTVENVTSSTADGTYKAGDTVSIQVRFDEAVTVTGTPQLTLETGTTDRVVDYALGSGETSLTFTYTVQAGDTSSDLDYTATTALALNGGTIRDAVGHAAVLTLSSPGAEYSLGANQDIVIDGIAPTVTLSGPTDAQNAAFTATITFSEAPVTGFALIDIVVGNGTASNLSETTTAMVWRASITPTTAGPVTVDVAAGAAQDQARNDNEAAIQFSVIYDNEAPTVTLSGPTTPQSGPFDVTFTFNEAVTGFALIDIVVGNGTASNLSETTTAMVWRASITPTAPAVTVDVAAGAAQDQARNDNEAAIQFSVIYDNVAPTVTLSGPTDPQNAAFTVTIAFNRAVTGFALIDIVVGNGTASNLSETTTAMVWTATITPTTAGPVTVDVAAGVAQDQANNDNTAAIQFSVIYDNEAPTVTLSGPTTPQSGPFDVTFTFNEAVTGFALIDIVVGNGTASNLSETTTAMVWTATITPTTAGPVTVDVAAGAAQDQVRNDNEAAIQFSVIYDNEAPTVTLSGPTTTQSGPFDVTFTFNEAVTGFALIDIAVGNGTASNLRETTTAMVWRASITPTAPAVTVDVAAGAAQDQARNDNEAAIQFSVIYDNVAPTVTLSGPTDPQNAAFTVTIAFNRVVTGFALIDIVVGNGTASNLRETTTAMVWTATITPTTAGPVTVDVAAGAAQDQARNDNTAAIQFSVIYDNVAPTVTLTASDAATGGTVLANGATTAGDHALNYTVTFSEAVTGFMAGDIALSGTATGTALSAGSFAGSSPTYTFAVNVTGDGTVAVDIAQAAATDQAGNDSDAAATHTVTVDTSPPTVTLVLNPTSVLENGGENDGVVTVMATLDRAGIAQMTMTVSAVPADAVTLNATMLTIEAGEMQSTGEMTIRPNDNEVDEPDRMVTVSAVLAANGQSMTPPQDVMLTIEDDDAHTLTISDTTVKEGDTASFTVTLSGVVASNVIVNWEAVDGTAMEPDDYTAASGLLTFEAHTTSLTQIITVPTVQDTLVEGDETFSVRLFNVSDTMELGISLDPEKSTATGTIENDVAAAQARVNRVNEQVLPYVTQAMTASTLSAITDRIDAVDSGAGSSGRLTLGGQSSLYDVLTSNAQALQAGTMNLEQLLAGSSFVLPLTDAEAGSGGLSVWGSGAYRKLSGTGDSPVDWDGDLFSFHLGADLRVRPDLLAGLSVSRSLGSFDYTDRTDPRALGGRYKSHMTSVHPYVNWSSPEGFGLWATVGYGKGKIRIDDDDIGKTLSSDTVMHTAAVGGSHNLVSTEDVIAGGTTTLRVKGEGSLARVKAEGSGLLNPLTADVQRLRLLFEGRHERQLASGGLLTPSLEVGLRHDSGDGATGAGFELGGGVRYVNPAIGLTVEGRGRVLLAHQDEYEDWGITGLFLLDPGADQQGLSLRLMPTVGQAASGIGRLYDQGMIGARPTDTAPMSRLDAELGYGFSVLDGRGLVTPFGGLSFAGEASRRYRVGGRLEVGSSFNLSLEGARQESGGTTPSDHGVMLQAELRW